MLCGTTSYACSQLHSPTILLVLISHVITNASNSPPRVGKPLTCLRCTDSQWLDLETKTFIQATNDSLKFCESESTTCHQHEEFCLTGSLVFIANVSSNDVRHLPTLRHPTHSGRHSTSTPPNKYIVSGCYGDKKINKSVIQGARCESYSLNFSLAGQLFPSSISFCICKTDNCNDHILFASYKSAKSWTNLLEAVQGKDAPGQSECENCTTISTSKTTMATMIKLRHRTTARVRTVTKSTTTTTTETPQSTVNLTLSRDDELNKHDRWPFLISSKDGNLLRKSKSSASSAELSLLKFCTFSSVLVYFCNKL